ncbi:hypothetical protein CC1G_12353 [Coprinopsis cinerea okayama7|uniref:Uncharacterized protein n=1 Tax=Coprinopsis cinerea (strain Okayama-7 / 130 / ATCC MYA-4618 / FGSC 9003) TaxID=240176 RepID=A8NJQ6_COPC7|nr:hypothetical protein CC1G_12353 [Coprinopsis cinerea okayama7\|eukprot:XP_001834274.1 hypothetical protein CC1G_12353 [Coprinopsis cinerea okayama7\
MPGPSNPKRTKKKGGGGQGKKQQAKKRAEGAVVQPSKPVGAVAPASTTAKPTQSSSKPFIQASNDTTSRKDSKLSNSESSSQPQLHHEAGDPGRGRTKKRGTTRLKPQYQAPPSQPQSIPKPQPPDLPSSNTSSESLDSTTTSSSSPALRTPPPLSSFLKGEVSDMKCYYGDFEKRKPIPEIDSDRVEEIMFTPPFIHDPGNGPRVRDAKAFLASRFFAQPPAWDNPMCAEFAQEEVLQMLMTVLPDETARILWYNKSRATSRICPACQRLYRLGDILPDHIPDSTSDSSESKPTPPVPPKTPSPYLYREQEISGLCSPVCFILASFNFPHAIKSTWGRMADEMDDKAWDLLNQPTQGLGGAALGGNGKGQGSVTGQALGMVVRMTRLHDLGLAQLCFGNEAQGGEDDVEEAYHIEGLSLRDR